MTIPAQANWKSLDRGIYVSAAMAICALVVAGFWPSYFSKLFLAAKLVVCEIQHLRFLAANMRILAEHSRRVKWLIAGAIRDRL